MLLLFMLENSFISIPDVFLILLDMELLWRSDNIHTHELSSSNDCWKSFNSHGKNILPKKWRQKQKNFWTSNTVRFLSCKRKRFTRKWTSYKHLFVVQTLICHFYNWCLSFTYNNFQLHELLNFRIIASYEILICLTLCWPP